jgi:hypothetical protein
MKMLSEHDNLHHLDSMLNSLFSAFDVQDRWVSVCLTRKPNSSTFNPNLQPQT